MGEKPLVNNSQVKMALYNPGFTKCPICNQIVGESQKRTGFTHFIEDDKDPLWRFSDAVFHYDCFMKWECKEEYLKRYRASGLKWTPEYYEPKGR